MNGDVRVRVAIWGREVGMLREDPEGRITFEYDPAFRASGMEMSPIHLPTARRGPISFPELTRKPAFAGLPGVFADALPDQFGNAVIRRYFEQRGRPGDALSPLQRLLYIGDRAMGALVFQPPLDPGPGTDKALEVRELVDQARRVVEGDVSVAVPEIMQVGGSAGGARPKALILWDRGAGRVRSGFARPEPGEEPWLIKFDGVTSEAAGQGMRAAGSPGPWGRIEYAYSNMARNAGIEVPETHLLRDGDLAHFMVRRFDRAPDEPPGSFQRFHFHSLGGMQHIDFNDQYVFSYEGWFDTIRAIGLGQRSVNEAFRRMVFAVATVNFDDHVKNFGFLMNPAGRWRLAPAYDVTYAENDAWTRQHQMSVNGKFREITRRDLLEVGEMFDVPRDGREIVAEVVEAVAGWPEHARWAGVPDRMVEWIQSRIRDVG